MGHCPSAKVLSAQPGESPVFAVNVPAPSSPSAELELELIQSHMAQKPVLRGEVGPETQSGHAFGI